MREEFGLPDEDRWTEFWPITEQESYAADVARLQAEKIAQAEALEQWRRVNRVVLERYGSEWRAAGYDSSDGLPAPDWLATDRPNQS